MDQSENPTKPICNTTTSDLRSIPIKRDHSPRSASWSDFVYAIGPVFWLFRQQVDTQRIEEALKQAVEFRRVVWTEWKAIWPNESRKKCKELIQDIMTESEFHRQYVHIGAKRDVQSAPWNEAMQSAISNCTFQRWADPQYVQQQQPPPPPPPTPFCSWEPYDGLSVEEAVSRIEREIAQRRRDGMTNVRRRFYRVDERGPGLGRFLAARREGQEGQEDEDWVYEWH
ncbi:hypothetical protein V5O48_012792 [Marasmius crinis-equi]|uniref:Uncharacterized protein n=1 Tax=Marasmius crinis-equi TaxID=585013 RepID=A0ABR3F1U8_9AGAR